MRTADRHRGRGVASRLLEHILEVSSRRGYRQLFLETDAMDAFRHARALYARFGFVERGPFGAYIDDPNSVIMVKDLG